MADADISEEYFSLKDLESVLEEEIECLVVKLPERKLGFFDRITENMRRLYSDSIDKFNYYTGWN